MTGVLITNQPEGKCKSHYNNPQDNEMQAKNEGILE